MSDLAFELLVPLLTQSTDSLLWVVDENIGDSEVARIPVRENIRVLCNRYDVSVAMKQRGFSVSLCDFELAAYPSKSFDRICYRVSKEKAVVHHVINNAGQWLKSGGSLFLSGYKNEGTKTYISKAEDYLGELLSKNLGGKTSMLAEIVANDIGEPLDDKDYRQLREIEGGFYSKPGIFGWNKIDKGSEFLIDKLPEFLQGFKSPPKTMIDIGCGYGYLSVMAGQTLDLCITATDNNIASVEMCRKNFQEHGVKGEAILDDCAESIDGSFDLLLCNPPFHQGFDIEGKLTHRFIAAARRLLKPGGRALFVVNGFIPLEKKAEAVFQHVEVVERNRSFKLVGLF